MQRNRRAILGALLVVVAFGLTAATLTNPTDTSGGSGSGPQVGSGMDPVTETPQGGGASGNASAGMLPISGGGACVPFLQTWQFYVLAAAGLLLMVLTLRRRAPTWVAVVMLVAVLSPGAALYGLFSKCGPPTNITAEDVASLNGTNQTPTGANITGGGGGSDVATNPPVLAIVGIVVAVVLVLLVVRGSGDDEFAEEEADKEPDDSALEDIADTAGTAADRIASAEDFENAVYEAWWEMTTHLDIEAPESTTPAEFAAAARAAGMDAEHVETLTELFREVRYGGEPVTEQRERQALDALRDIEATYGAEDGE